MSWPPLPHAPSLIPIISDGTKLLAGGPVYFLLSVGMAMISKADNRWYHWDLMVCCDSFIIDWVDLLAGTTILDASIDRAAVKASQL